MPVKTTRGPRRTLPFRAAIALLAALGLPQVPHAQQSDAVQPDSRATIPITDWDDDWWYPEGPIRILGVRYSLFAGAIVTAFGSETARDRFGARLIDPNVTLYRPGHRGTFLDVDFAWIGLTRSGEKARYVAPTVGVRHSFVESMRRQTLVPFGTLRVGPYFARTTGDRGRMVFGANATLGVHVARRISLAVRYDRLARVNGVDLSTLSLDVAVAVPIGTPRGAAAKMTDFVPPPGRMIDLGAHRLHLVCLGAGTPTVVLESGLSDAWITWSKVQPVLASTTRVCAYDRAGIGYSEPGPAPRTSDRIAQELHALLQQAGIAGPYVLVGHSFGGLNVRRFAARYPGEVAGMVLVDASHEDQWSRCPAEVRRRMDETLEQLRLRAEAAAEGKPVSAVVTNLPVAVASRPAWQRTLYEELRSLQESSDQVRASERTLRVPLVVVSAGKAEWRGVSRRARAEMRRLWSELQASLVHLSPQGMHVTATHSGHYVQREAPQLVIDAVRRVIATHRRHDD